MTDIGAGHYSVNHHSQVILEVLVHGQLACMIATTLFLRLHGSKFVLLLAIAFILILCVCGNNKHSKMHEGGTRRAGGGYLTGSSQVMALQKIITLLTITRQESQEACIIDWCLPLQRVIRTISHHYYLVSDLYHYMYVTGTVEDNLIGTTQL